MNAKVGCIFEYSTSEILYFACVFVCVYIYLEAMEKQICRK